MAFELPGLKELQNPKAFIKMLLTPAVNIEATISELLQSPARAAGLELPEIPLPATLIMSMLSEKAEGETIQERIDRVKKETVKKKEAKTLRGEL